MWLLSKLLIQASRIFGHKHYRIEISCILHWFSRNFNQNISTLNLYKASDINDYFSTIPSYLNFNIIVWFEFFSQKFPILPEICRTFYFLALSMRKPKRNISQKITQPFKLIYGSFPAPRKVLVARKVRQKAWHSRQKIR